MFVISREKFERRAKVDLLQHKQLMVIQRLEIAELFGYETRNKYEILDAMGKQVAFAAEQQKGILNFLFRQNLGHWRRFDVSFFTPNRELFMIANHPFRWFFARIELKDAAGKYYGAIQKRWSIFSKRFDLEDDQGNVFLQVSSPFWRMWTFSFKAESREKAVIRKKWSGVLFESFTDKDKFLIEFMDPTLADPARKLILAAAIFIDLLFFERKAE